MRVTCGLCWPWWSHARAAQFAHAGSCARGAHLVRGRGDGHAMRIRSTGGASTGGDRSGSSQWSPFFVPLATRGSTQDFVMGARRICSVVQVTGFTLHLLRLDLKVLIPSPFSRRLLGRRECPIGCNVWSADYPSARKGTRAHYRHAFGGCRIPPSGQALVGGCQGERRLPLSSACRVFEVDHSESGARIDG